MKIRLKLISSLSIFWIFCFLVVGCGQSQKSNSENLVPPEDTETIYTKHLLKNYFIGGGCKSETYSEGTIRTNSTSYSSRNGWTIDSDSENFMEFNVLQITDISMWSQGIDGLVFSRLREIGPDPEANLGIKNINTLSMLVFLEQTIGESDAAGIIFKKEGHDLSAFSKNKSKIKNLHKLIRSNADVACGVIGKMGRLGSMKSLEASEQRKLDEVDKDLRKIIGFNGKNEITEIEKWLATTWTEGWLGEQRKQRELEKASRKAQENEEAWQEYLESEIPKCVEYPSDNPKYTIIKCTNLP